MKFVLAGGSGSLGSRLVTRLLSAGHEVIVLTRNPRPISEVLEIEWDGKTVGDWSRHLRDAVIVNLAGVLVDLRPTPENIALLRSSRVDATLALKGALQQRGLTAPLWLQMSTVAIYGDGGDRVLDEKAQPQKALPQMTGVAQPWEEAAAGAPADRFVVLRTGVVLDTGTPAFDRLAQLTKIGLGGRVGSGSQWISWLHIEDFLAAVQFVIDTPSISDIVHLTSPQPVQNQELMRAFRRTFRRPWAPPTPEFAVKAGAFVLGSDPALALTGRRCIPAKLLEAGFEFRFPEIGEALADLMKRKSL